MCCGGRLPECAVVGGCRLLEPGPTKASNRHLLEGPALPLHAHCAAAYTAPDSLLPCAGVLLRRRHKAATGSASEDRLKALGVRVTTPGRPLPHAVRAVTGCDACRFPLQAPMTMHGCGTLLCLISALH